MVDAPARLFAGFDGGGTKTRCVLCDSHGSVLGVGSGGASNYHNAGLKGAVASLRAAFSEALAASGMSEGRASLAACFGLAGLDSPEDFAIITRAIRSARFAPSGWRESRPFGVMNDWRPAVAGAFVDDPGVVLIAGTGCVAAVQGRGGREVVRVGGWGPVVDDRGSAYDIGREALYAAMRDFDGRGPKTSLLPLLMRRLKVARPQGIIARINVDGMSVPEIASLSTLVSRAASDGDPVAMRIFATKARDLGELVVSAASRLGMLGTRFGVHPHGGVFKAGPPILGPLKETIRASAPRAELVEAKLVPACGAVVLLYREAGIEVDGKTVARMSSSFKRASEKSQAATRRAAFSRACAGQRS